MKTDLFSGDPKVTLDPDGADMLFLGGQPVMDQGWENFVFISLFTDEEWAGNVLLNPDEKIGSKFEKLANSSITLTNLNDMRIEAESALKSESFGKITVDVQTPSSHQYKTRILISPPDALLNEIELIKNGQNWIQQKVNPAHERV